jgi:hypothetical protein
MYLDGGAKVMEGECVRVRCRVGGFGEEAGGRGMD